MDGWLCVWSYMYRSVCRSQVLTVGIDPQVPFSLIFELGPSLGQRTHCGNFSLLPAVFIFSVLRFTNLNHHGLLFKGFLGITLRSSLPGLPVPLFAFYTIWGSPYLHFFSTSLVFPHNCLRNILLKLTDFKTPDQLIYKE